MKHADARGRFFSGATPSAKFDGAAAQGTYERLGKRAFDVALAIALAPFVSVVIAVLCAAVFAADRRAPLFGHRRMGRGAVPFTCWKVRTMAPDAEARLERILAEDPESAAEWRANHKLAHDPRITRIGEFLRRTSLDELPQIWNVLRGEMSFVGPRPERPEFVRTLAARIPYYNERHRVKPGITGWAQICYGYTASERDAREKLEYDLYYVKNYSPLFDLYILLRTIEVVLWGRGAH